MSNAVIQLLLEGLSLSVMISAVPLGACFIVGLFSSIFQAATQIQDQTFTFIPKLVATVMTAYYFGPAAWSRFQELAIEIFQQMAAF